MSASSLTDFFLYVCGNKIGPLKQILALQIFILAVSLGIYARDVPASPSRLLYWRWHMRHEWHPHKSL